MRTTHLICMLLVLITSSMVSAQDTKPQSPAAQSPAARSPAKGSVAVDRPTDPDLAAIRANAYAFTKAFNQADAAGVASLWAEKGEYIDTAGTEFVGRTAIESAYEEYFQNNPKASIRINIDSLRRLGETAAIEEGSSLVEVPPGSSIVGRYTAFHVKVDGKWQMASVRDALVESSADQQDLADLDWLIGTWVAEEHGNKNVSTCRWVSQGSFVQRDFTTTLFDGSSQSSGVQLIGWNPQGRHVQSWTFSSGGGHDVGVWMATSEGWAAQMRGMTGDGTPTTATNLLRRLDDNAYVWQSVNRSVGGIPVADTNEIVIRRQPATK